MVELRGQDSASLYYGKQKQTQEVYTQSTEMDKQMGVLMCTYYYMIVFPIQI